MSEFKNMPCFTIDKIVYETMLKYLNGEEIGAIITAIYDTIYKGETKVELKEKELYFFDMLLGCALDKADAWLRRSSNFKNNNPNRQK